MVRLPVLSRLSRRLIGLALLGTLALGTAIADLDARLAMDRANPSRPADTLLLPSVPVLRALGLGQDTLVASLLWTRAVAYFGEHFSKDRRYRWLETYVESIGALDPAFRRLYEWGGVVVMYGGMIDNRSVRASSAILERGLQVFPDDWQFAFMLGCNYVFELQAADPAQKKLNTEIGITYLRRAAANKAAPPHLPGLVATLYRKAGWLEAAATYLEEAYLHAESPQLREDIAARLAAYRSQAQLARLQDEAQLLEQQWRASYPYLPTGLFRLVGPRDAGWIVPWQQVLNEELAENDDEALAARIVDTGFAASGLRQGGLELPPENAAATQETQQQEAP